MKYFFVFALLVAGRVSAQEAVHVTVDERRAYQTMENFGASDAWACQFVGGWEGGGRKQMADWLFSTDTLRGGAPKGIGLTMWRMNLGAGSAEQGDSSGIKDEWRRAADVMGGRGTGAVDGRDRVQTVGAGAGDRVAAQLWFLQAARERGVRQFLGFFNSPPVWMTRNGKAYATKGRCNIDPGMYPAFAGYAVDVIRRIKGQTGVALDYLSPVNEPEWAWSDGGQEGCPYSRAEIAGLVRVMDSAMMRAGLRMGIVAPEAGDLHFLLKDTLRTRSGIMAGHSYFTTSPWKDGVALRQRLAAHIDSLRGAESKGGPGGVGGRGREGGPGLRYWQTEYCILGNNAGDIDGSQRDSGMEAALYLARVIHMDLVYGQATAWQWWLAISPYNYKDGLIYVDKEGRGFSASKKMWALGNYSRWIRPGMRRVEVEVRGEGSVANEKGTGGSGKDADSLLVSAYASKKNLVIVVVNASFVDQDMFIDRYIGKMEAYVTSGTEDLGRHMVGKDGRVKVGARSVCTVVVKK